MRRVHIAGWSEVLLTSGFLMLGACLLIAHAHPAGSYELDLYRATPLSVWILLVLATTIGIATAVRATFRPRVSLSQLFPACGLALGGRLSAEAIPFARGYAIFGGDQASHVGTVRELVTSGHLGSNNFYPVTHIQLAATTLTSGLLDTTIMALIALVISAIFILGTALLCHAIFCEPRGCAIAWLLTIGLSPSLIVTPNAWSLLLLPLALLVMFMPDSLGRRVLLIGVAILFPLFHPLTALILGVIMALHFVSSKRLSRIVMVRPFPHILGDGVTVGRAGLLLAVVYALWILSFTVFYGNIRLLWVRLASLIAGSEFSGVVTQLNKLQLTGADIALLFVHRYGVVFVIGVLALAEMLWLWSRGRDGQIVSRDIYLAQLAVPFAVVSFVFIGHYVGLPGTRAVAGVRFLLYAGILGIPLAAASLMRIIRRWRSHFTVQVSCVLLLVTIAVIGGRSAYQSPAGYEPNAQVTNMTIKAEAWMLTHINNAHRLGFVMTPPSRFMDLLWGTAEGDIQTQRIRAVQFADHFGYDQRSALADQYDGPLMTTLTYLDEVLYQSVWKSVGRFNSGDFVRLDQDSSVTQVYSNREGWGYNVR